MPSITDDYGGGGGKNAKKLITLYVNGPLSQSEHNYSTVALSYV